MSSHSTFSPSSAKRWMNCTASLDAIAALPPSLQNGSGVAAVRGTALHLLAEHKLALSGAVSDIDSNSSKSIAEREKLLTEFRDDEEGLQCVDSFIAHIRSLTRLGAVVYSELRASYNHIIPNGFGTVDAAIYDRVRKHLIIVDLKTGRIPVYAEDNEQLKIYALATINTLGVKADKITMAISQNGFLSTSTITMFELDRFREDLALVGTKIITGDTDYVASASTCLFCPVAPTCAAFHNKLIGNNDMSTTLNELPAVNTLSDSQLVALAQNAKAITKYLNTVSDYVLEIAKDGGLEDEDVSVVPVKGRFKVDVTALERLGDDGLFVKKPLGIVALRKQLSEEDLDEVLIQGDETYKVSFSPKQQKATALPFQKV